MMNRVLLFLWSITTYAMQLAHAYVRFGFGLLCSLRKI